jgi:hypothetical protein
LCEIASRDVITSSAIKQTSQLNSITGARPDSRDAGGGESGVQRGWRGETRLLVVQCCGTINDAGGSAGDSFFHAALGVVAADKGPGW